jgi:capsular polysaccharide transport system permease protein
MQDNIKKIKFFDSLVLQFQVIKALMIRELLSEHERKNIGFLWLFVEPLIFLIVIILLRGAFFHTEDYINGIPFLGFLLTGYIVFMMFRRGISYVGSAADSNRNLLFHRNITVLDLFYSRFFLEFLSLSFVLIFLNLVFFYFGFMKLPTDYLKASIGWFFINWFLFSVGLIFSYFNYKSTFLKRNRMIIMFLILPFSGITFMVSWLPISQQDYFLWWPSMHAMELFREGYFGTNIKAIYSFSFLIFTNFFLFLFGLALAGKLKRELEKAE